MDRPIDAPIQASYSKQLEELSRLTGELAHEIRNPLSTIMVNLKLAREQLEQSDLTKNSDVVRALRKLTVIQEEADRLDAILAGFLRYIGKSEIQAATVDVNQVVGDMIDFYLPQAYNGGVTLRRGLTREPLACRADAVMLKQALLNLFINAQQAMPQGGDLMVRTDRQLDWAIIEVSDTGCGIEAEKLDRVFEAYRSSKPRGTGLGLATVRKIVEAHHGSISVMSEPGKGTSFTIRLPLLAAGGGRQEKAE